MLRQRFDPSEPNDGSDLTDVMENTMRLFGDLDNVVPAERKQSCPADIGEVSPSASSSASSPCSRFSMASEVFMQNQTIVDAELSRNIDALQLTDADRARLRARYRCIPEEFYKTTGFQPVTPANVKDWTQARIGEQRDVFEL